MISSKNAVQTSVLDPVSRWNCPISNCAIYIPPAGLPVGIGYIL
jgi:hypothetical protein